MPTVPRFVADRAESWFGRPTQVADIEDLSPVLRRVRFTGAALRGRPWTPGHEIELRVAERDLRHYTPARHDGVAGTCDVVFYRHGAGPGRRWIDALTPDAEVRILGPGGGHGLVRRAAGHVFLGDDTAIGLFEHLATTIVHAPHHAALELDPASADVRLPFSSTRMRRTPHDRGGELLRWLDSEGAAWLERLGVAYYLAGHAQTIQALRRILRDRRVPSSSIRTYAYWADGKVGM